MTRQTGRARKAILTGAAALGLALGSVGIGWATGSSATPAGPPTQEPAEVAEPTYHGSITAPADDETLGETESAALAGLATISADEAAAAANAAVPGDVGKVELDDENGTVVYSVEITDSAGAEIDGKVDAGNGAILSQQADDDAGELDEGEVAEESEAAGDEVLDGVDHQVEGEETGNNDDGIPDADCFCDRLVAPRLTSTLPRDRGSQFAAWCRTRVPRHTCGRGLVDVAAGAPWL